MRRGKGDGGAAAGWGGGRGGKWQEVGTGEDGGGDSTVRARTRQQGMGWGGERGRPGAIGDLAGI